MAKLSGEGAAATGRGALPAERGALTTGGVDGAFAPRPDDFDPDGWGTILAGGLAAVVSAARRATVLLAGERAALALPARPDDPDPDGPAATATAATAPVDFDPDCLVPDFLAFSLSLLYSV